MSARVNSAIVVRLTALCTIAILYIPMCGAQDSIIARPTELSALVEQPVCPGDILSTNIQIDGAIIGMPGPIDLASEGCPCVFPAAESITAVADGPLTVPVVITPGSRSNGKYSGKIRLSQGAVNKHLNVIFFVQELILYQSTIYGKFIDADFSDLATDQYHTCKTLKSVQRNPKGAHWDEVIVENAGVLSGIIAIQHDQSGDEKYLITISDIGAVPYGQINAELRLAFLLNGSTVKTRTFPIRITNLPVGESCNRRQLLINGDVNPKIVRIRNRDGTTINILDYSLFDAGGIKIADASEIGIRINLENGSVAVRGEYSGNADYPLSLHLHYSSESGPSTYAIPVMAVPK